MFEQGCPYTGCNMPEGECSGACLGTKPHHTGRDMSQEKTNETLATICDRHDCPEWIGEALLSDPAILAHVPGVVALREENADLKRELEITDGLQRQRIADLEAQLAAVQGGEAKVPPGYALVPIEPTDEMISAGLSFADNKLLWHISRGAAQDFYKAMLSAAPVDSVEEGKL